MSNIRLEGPRNPNPHEMGEVMRLADEAFRTPNANPPSAENLYPLLYSKNNIENLWIFLDDGNPVSLVGSLPNKAIIGDSEIPVAWIGEVCTKKSYSNQGLATRLLKETFLKLKLKGIVVAIVTGELNLYKRLECVKSGLNKHLLIEKGGKSPENVSSTLNSWNNDKIRNIYRKEKVRWKRDKEEFSKLLAAQAFPREHEQIPKIYCAGDGPKEEGYWTFGLYSRPKNGERELKVVEYAGSRKALGKSIPLLLEKETAKLFSLSVPIWDREFLDHLTELSEENVINIIKKEKRFYPGTMKILNEGKLKNSIKTIEREFGLSENTKSSNDLLSLIPWPWTENLNWM